MVAPLKVWVNSIHISLKQWIVFSRALIGYSTFGYPVLFTDSPPVSPSKRSQIRISYEKNGFPQFAAVTNKEVSQIIKQAVPKIHEEGDKIRFGIFNR